MRELLLICVVQCFQTILLVWFSEVADVQHHPVIVQSPLLPACQRVLKSIDGVTLHNVAFCSSFCAIITTASMKPGCSCVVDI